MKNLALLLLLFWAFALNAANHKDPIKDVKETYQSIKQKFNPDDQQFITILKNDKIKQYLKDTPIDFWIEAFNTPDVNQKAMPRSFFKSELTTYTLLDSVVLDISDLELGITNANLEFTYNGDYLCERVAAFVSYGDSSVCLGAIELSYNENDLIDTLTVLVADSDTSLVTMGSISAVYNENDDIIQMGININFDEIVFENAIVITIEYDENNQLSLVDVYGKEAFFNFADHYGEMPENDFMLDSDSILLAEAAITRNEHNDITSVYAKYNDLSDSVWVGFKASVEYQDTLITSISLYDGIENGEWILVSVKDITYNANGDITSETFSENTEDGLLNMDKREYLYNNELNIAIYEYYYNIDVNEWVFDVKDTIIYDENEMISQIAGFQFIDDEWMPEDVFFYTFDSDGLLLDFMNGYYVDSTLQYDGKIEFNYNDDSRLASFYTWYYEYEPSYDEENDTYTNIEHVYPSDKDTLIWDDNLIAGFTSFYFDRGDSAWHGSAKIVISRDDFENFAGVEFSVWPDSLTDWVSVVQLDIEYDETIQLPEIEVPDLFSEFSDNMMFMEDFDSGILTDVGINPRDFMLKMFGYNSMEEVYANVQVNNAPTTISLNANDEEEAFGVALNFYYSKVDDVSAPEISNAEVINIYPNPATDVITVNGANIENGRINIYDTSGRTVMQKSLLQTNVVNISSLIKGLYLYTVTSEKNQAKGKFIVK